MASKKKVLITGISGFAGNHLARHLIRNDFKVIGASRTDPQIDNVKFYPIGDLKDGFDWPQILSGVDYVVHLANRAHKMNDRPENEHLYFKINVDATLNLARQAAGQGVKKFVFISSVKAAGEETDEKSLSENMPCTPSDAYGRSKLQAEQQLEKLAVRSDMAVVSLRPPLMYGPGVKGNMASLIKLVKTMPILPLGGIKNRRSFIGIGNFSSAIEAVIMCEKQVSGIYYISDDMTVSTSKLVDLLIKAFSPSTRNLALPESFWYYLNKIPLIKEKTRRLTGSLEVDC
ncbi:MAG: NAD-dependent epimerase/dehydratase family protein, partial [Candidatus Rifleibacteriota bacterium]